MMKQYLEEREGELLDHFARVCFQGKDYDKLSPDNKDIVVKEIHTQVLKK